MVETVSRFKHYSKDPLLIASDTESDSVLSEYESSPEWHGGYQFESPSRVSSAVRHNVLETKEQQELPNALNLHLTPLTFTIAQDEDALPDVRFMKKKKKKKKKKKTKKKKKKKKNK